MELLLALATNTRPSVPIVTAVVPLSPVAAPLSVVSGAALPEAPSANEWTALLPPLTTYTADWTCGFTLRLNCAVAFFGDGLAESVTLTLKLLVPAVAGVPVIVPLADSERAVGSVPRARPHFSAPAPATAVSFWVYGRPIAASGSGS